MSTKVPTEVKCHDNGSAKKTTIDIKCQKLTPKVPLQANCQCKLAPPESRCWSVKNPWIARIGATFAISAILVIYGALYSRLGERMEARDKTMSEVEKLINGLQERIEELEARCPYVEGSRNCPNGPSVGKGGIAGSPSIASVGVVESPTTDGPVNLPVVGGRDNGIPTSTISSKNVRAGSKKKSKSKKKKLKRELVYTRWGGNECRGEAKVVYTGHVAGANAFQTGGGSNYLCMPSSPKYHGREDSSNSDRAFLYPVKFGDVADVRSRNINGPQDNHGVSCAVCRTESSLEIMVPGSYECPTHWKFEYKGYLMAQRDKHTTTEYICVDAYSPGIANTTATGRDRDQSFLSLVQYKCLDPSCGEYYTYKHKELACVVCSTQ